MKAITAVAFGWLICGPVERVIDGDTLVIAERHIRLRGIEAPGLREPGGPEAKVYLEDMVADNPRVCCLDVGERSFDRGVGFCFLGDVGRYMIEAAHAVRAPEADRDGHYVEGPP